MHVILAFVNQQNIIRQSDLVSFRTKVGKITKILADNLSLYQKNNRCFLFSSGGKHGLGQLIMDWIYN
jgi:hypothetical protein